MRCVFRKVLGFIPVVFGVIVFPARAGHFFAIQQSGISWEEEKLTAVTINKKSRTYQIANNPELLFKKATEDFLLQKTAEEFLLQKTADKKLEEPKFKLTIDLKDIYSGSLENISIFLSKLAETKYPNSHVNLSVPLLVIENGTSFKFNKIFPGISGFFQNMSQAEVRYYHAGIRYPRAAEKGLGSLADPIAQIKGKITTLKLTKRQSIKESIFDVKKVEDLIPTICGADKCVEVINLKGRWESFSKKFEGEQVVGNWPPLGVVKKEQITNVYTGDSGDLPPPVVLDVSGLLNDDMHIQQIINFCWENQSIRCVRIQNSMCTLANLEGFFKKRDDKNGDTLLGSRIRFLDIETALDENLRPVDLPEYFRSKNQEDFLRFLIWENPFLCPNESFKREWEDNHQLFSVFLEYLMLLQSEDYLSLLK